LSLPLGTPRPRLFIIVAIEKREDDRVTAIATSSEKVTARMAAMSSTRRGHDLVEDNDVAAQCDVVGRGEEWYLGLGCRWGNLGF
jgi:hypothetical protein